MKQLLLAVFVVAAPAVARAQDSRDGWDHGDWSDPGQRYDGYQYNDEQQPPPPPEYGQPDDDSWSADESAYAGQSGPTFDDFRNDRALRWNGQWIETPEYGLVWRPTRVSDDWQPYMYGRWVSTAEGWAWASDEPFGWAVYHYGRWAWSPASGWMWVPGRVWAPAWVTWRWTDGYAAWCPMGVRSSYIEHPAVWVVVPTRAFLEPVVHHVVPRPERRRYVPMPVPGVQRSGPMVSVIERATGRAVRPLPIQDAHNAGAARAGLGSVIFYRPRTAPIAQPVQQGPRAVPPTNGPTRPERHWFGAPVPNVRPDGAPPPQRPQPIQAQPQAVPQRPPPAQPPTRSFGQAVSSQQPPVTAQPPVAAPRPLPALRPEPVAAGNPHGSPGVSGNPHGEPGVSGNPHASPGESGNPHATAPVARSNAEQEHGKDR